MRRWIQKKRVEIKRERSSRFFLSDIKWPKDNGVFFTLSNAHTQMNTHVCMNIRIGDVWSLKMCHRGGYSDSYLMMIYYVRKSVYVRVC